MELAFVEKDLRDLCANRARLDLRFGVERAEALRHRLADLRAAATIHELIDAPSPCRDGEEGRMALPIQNGFRLIFCANYRSVPMNEAGDVDWAHVSRIKILMLEGADD